MEDNIFLYIASFFSGIWNVINETFVSVKRSVALFMLGFGFCLASSYFFEWQGYDQKVSYCFGYVIGILSPKIYDVLLSILAYVPDIFIMKFGTKPAKKKKK